MPKNLKKLTNIKIPFNDEKLITRIDGKTKVEFFLGKGQYGGIFLAQKVDNGEFVAVKALRDKHAIDASVKEVGILNRLKDCRNIIQYFDMTDVTDGEKLTRYQFMELASGGSGTRLKQIALLDDLDAKTKIMLHIIDSLIKGLKNCHDKNVFHLDLKPDNFVFSNDGKINIIDFGCAYFGIAENCTQINGDQRYNSPQRQVIVSDTMKSSETVSEETKTTSKFDATSADLYSLGITLYEIWIGINDYERQVGLEGDHIIKFHQKVHDEFKTNNEIDKNPALKIIYGLLQVDEKVRLTVDQVRTILDSKETKDIIQLLPSDDLSIPKVEYKKWEFDKLNNHTKVCDVCSRFLDYQVLYRFTTTAKNDIIICETCYTEATVMKPVEKVDNSPERMRIREIEKEIAELFKYMIALDPDDENRHIIFQDDHPENYPNYKPRPPSEDDDPVDKIEIVKNDDKIEIEQAEEEKKEISHYVTGQNNNSFYPTNVIKQKKINMQMKQQLEDMKKDYQRQIDELKKEIEESENKMIEENSNLKKEIKEGKQEE